MHGRNAVNEHMVPAVKEKPARTPELGVFPYMSNLIWPTCRLMMQAKHIGDQPEYRFHDANG